MINLNRIGARLGLVGGLGILLSVAIIGNQVLSERSIIAANQSADLQQAITDHELEADVALRRLQLSVRDIRLATSPGEVEKNAKALNEIYAPAGRHLNEALSRVLRAENKARLDKILARADEYKKGTDDLISTQRQILALVDRRNQIAADWTRNFGALRSDRTVANVENPLELERSLLEVDAMFNATRAAAWRLVAMSEGEQLPVIQQGLAGLKTRTAKLEDAVKDRELANRMRSLSSMVKDFTAATEEMTKLEEIKRNLVEVKTTPVADEALKLMREGVDAAESITRETRQQASSELARVNRVNLIGGALVMVALIGLVVFAFVGISRPLTLLNGAMGRMAKGDFDAEIPGLRRGDEIGDIARTVGVIRSNAEQKAREEAEAKARQGEIMARQRRADMVKMADGFEAAVGEIVERVSSASTELEASAGSLNSTADRSQALAATVATASEQTSANVQTVATATEEMAASVTEIGRQVHDAARMAGAAVEQARSTTGRVSELSKSAARIGDVVELINSIAAQTNLLALNATIEAARAGDAGRGFAVVASEVKALAEQTAKATEDIGQQVSGIQVATRESAGAIKEISATIEHLAEISSAIAAAVEEQGAATQEIARNVQQAALGTQQVNSSMGDVQQGAGETGSASIQLLSAAKALSGDSNRLKLEVRTFLDTVRVA